MMHSYPACSISSIILLKGDLLPEPNSRVKIMEGAKNNYPDENAYHSAQEIYNLASSLGEDDIALTLISGARPLLTDVLRLYFFITALTVQVTICTCE